MMGGRTVAQQALSFIKAMMARALQGDTGATNSLLLAIAKLLPPPQPAPRCKPPSTTVSIRHTRRSPHIQDPPLGRPGRVAIAHGLRLAGKGRPPPTGDELRLD